ncbi:uncharacterized protein [Pyrus communis]|uniref:uncharacterized protein n=1 Tax=Pyrus communis TaxID=23211 RepID=UPI0035C10B5A
MMKLEGKIGNRVIQVFIDCGATHNFLNPVVAKKAGLRINSAINKSIIVANDATLTTKGLAHAVMVEMQGYTLKRDFLLLAVSGCDLVLGAEWLESLGMIGWHFLNKTMDFDVDGVHYRLQGQTSFDASVVKSSVMMKFLNQEKMGVIAQLVLVPDVEPPTLSVSPEIRELIDQFKDLFEAPTHLPPEWTFDHRIPLIPGTSLINVCPYKYLHFQKID